MVYQFVAFLLVWIMRNLCLITHCHSNLDDLFLGHLHNKTKLMLLDVIDPWTSKILFHTHDKSLMHYYMIINNEGIPSWLITCWLLYNVIIISSGISESPCMLYMIPRWMSWKNRYQLIRKKKQSHMKPVILPIRV